MKKTKIFRIIFTFLLVGLIVGLIVWMVSVLLGQSKSGNQSPVYASRMIEAGEEFSPEIFLRDKDETVSLLEESVYDLHTPGDYVITLVMGDGSMRTVTLQVRDTTPPKVGQLPIILVKKDAQVPVEELLSREHITDATKVQVSLIATMSTAKEGIHEVAVKAEDLGGNTLRVNVSYYVTDRLNSDYTYEIGQIAPSAEELLPGCSAMLDEGHTAPTVPGRIPVSVEVFGGTYLMYYTAKDTIAPVGTVKDEEFSFNVGDALPEDPAIFIENVQDATAVSVTYAEDYAFTVPEKKVLSLVLTDLGGNKTTVSVTVTVYDKNEGADTIAPVFSGVKDLETTLGVAPDYLAGISVYDGRDGHISNDRITVDTSAVKLSEISSGRGYPVTYTISDAAGNQASATAYVKVVRPAVSEEEMNALFEDVMKNLDTAGLSRFSVLSQVYDYITRNYRFLSENANTDGSDYKTEAYWGFKLKNGNHETYYAMTAVILDRLSIEHIKVNRQLTGSEAHCWLLVNYGVGWLYMDCTPLEGYVWAKNGKLYKSDDPEAKLLSAADIRERAAMTDFDIAQLTALLNQYVPGWNYYKADVAGGVLPATAIRDTNGGYTAQKYKITYKVSGSYGKIEGASVQTLTHGEKTASVTAVATNPGYRFVRWSDGVTTATRSDVALLNTTITAEFELFTIDVYTVLYGAGEGGSISGAQTQSKRYNESTSTVTAVPAKGYYFVSWSDGNKNASRSDKVTANAEYTAIFAPMITIEYSAAEGGSILGSSTQTLIPGVGGEYVTARPNPGYLFLSWSDGVTSAQRKDTSDVSLQLTANFIKDTSSYTFKYMASAGGTIEGMTMQTLVCSERTSAVMAVAQEGYVFVSWSDGVTEASRSDIVYGNTTVTANFRKLNEYTVIYTVGEGGSIVGVAQQKVYEGQSCSEVTALPLEGYEFVSWSDGNTNPTRCDAPEGNLAFEAIFQEIKTPEPVTVSLQYSAGEGGSILGETEQTVEVGQSGSEVSAVAQEGYRFVSWSDGVTEAVRSDAPTQDTVLTAQFERIEEPEEEPAEEIQ
ncbi:MAG: InlB B-repeat-containing protein [Clostridia bacterium]|nr:InlB B-repeat-containing protein [Clostridia bacterium]